MNFKSVISEIIENKFNVVLNESDKRKAIESAIGFSPEWAEAFHSLSEKLSVWIANTFLKTFMDTEYMVGDTQSKKAKTASKEEVLKYLNTEGPNKVRQWNTKYKDEYRYILDWLTNPRRGMEVNIKELDFKKALEFSEEWHQALTDTKDKDYKEVNEIVIDYRKNGVGYYWANLNTGYSEEESKRMGHCGRDSGTTLFSLRSINEYGEGQSYITMSYQLDTKKINQIKGKKNSKPKKVYESFIIDMLTNNKFHVMGLTKNSYASHNNFQLNDLSEKELNGIFQKNRDIKIDYLFGDKKNVYKNESDNDIVLFKDENESIYGVVNVETLEIIKDYEYKIDELSDYSAFIHFNTTSDVYILKDFSSIKENKHFIILIHKNLFSFVDKEKADELIRKYGEESN